MAEKESEAEMRRSRRLTHRREASILRQPPHPYPVPHSCLLPLCPAPMLSPSLKQRKVQASGIGNIGPESWQIRSGPKHTENMVD